ncbi:MAG TPA: bacillithiol biosynthesis cysteine-adding enzyme BshC [Terriglobales bacterium]|nr:bacillithiol biosynthesis cysteine-adding enzyme BshC [Terriglobales bacterium]
MKSECLPFSAIPHVSRLFTDFLYDYPRVRSFYRRSPYITEWLREEAAAISYPAGRRQSVGQILQRQNESWGCSAQTMANIARLRSGAAAIVTGQQVGLFGGPLFSLYKALTAIKLAQVATEMGVDCVPVFWLATEDHDLAEVNRVSIPGPEGLLETLAASIEGQPDAPVGMLRFDAQIRTLLAQAITWLGETPVAQALRDSYRPGEGFGSAFARLFAFLFADWGVVLLDASDPELHQIAAPLYREAIQRNAELHAALSARGQELEAAGYHQQVKVTPSSTLLFTLNNGARVPLERNSDETNDGTFKVGKERLGQGELLARMASSPQQFSGNVLLRPVVEDFLLPTLAYTGGAAEVAYFAQAGVVHEKLLGRATPIVPRFSATIVESKPKRLLEQYQLNVTDLFHSPEHLREALAARALPAELQSAFEQAGVSLQHSLEAIRAALARLDKTLVEATENAAAKMQHQLDGLHARAARAELRQTEVLRRHGEVLTNALYPNQSLQERELAGIYFLSRHGTELLHVFYDAIPSDCLDHQVISL